MEITSKPQDLKKSWFPWKAHFIETTHFLPDGKRPFFSIHITPLTLFNYNLFNLQLKVPQITITIFNFDFLKMSFSAFLTLELYKNVIF